MLQSERFACQSQILRKILIVETGIPYIPPVAILFSSCPFDSPFVGGNIIKKSSLRGRPRNHTNVITNNKNNNNRYINSKIENSHDDNTHTQ